MAIKLEMLRTFRVVAEQGSLTAASALLARTPSAVSMTLAQLEDHVGAPLFETDRKNRLTPLGQLVLEESSRATDAFAHCVDAIGRHAISTAGIVRIAAVPSATVTVLPRAIAAFRHVRPDVRFEISDVDSATVLRRVKLDEVDIGIVSAAVDGIAGGAASGPANGAADGTVILQDDLGIVCRRDGPIARAAEGGSPVSWALLDREPIIANPLCHLIDHDAVRRSLAACNLEARNTTALLSFVRAGLGATVLPRGALQHQPEDLAFLMPADPATRRTLRKIRPEDRHLGSAARAFWDAL